MSRFKKILFLALLVYFPCVWASICVSTTTNIELNAGASFHGHEMAITDTNFSDVKFYNANNELDFANQMQAMTSEACSVILGIITSRECLIAGPYLQNNKVVGISSCCGHDAITKYYPYLYAGVPPISKEAEAIVAHLLKNKNNGTVFAIYQPTNVYSIAQFSYFKQKYPREFVAVVVGSDGQFDLEKFKQNKNKPQTLLFFTYPLPSVKIIFTLSNNNLIDKSTQIIGSSSWSDETTLFKPLKPILQKASNVFEIEVLDWNKVKNSPFIKNFVKKFKRTPLNVEILNYDTTKLAIHCYQTALNDGKFNHDAFTQCLARNNYQGVTGVIQFDKHSSFVDRPVYLTKLLDRI